ncbi:MAG: hypothetical protein IT536_12335 [Hyphomicrobiales bacterium]|nr:hypothetical protein [Hyphomicrobiales bacterium]
MAVLMRLVLLVLLAVPAQAQPSKEPTKEKVEADTNLFCDTREQVERFVTLFDPDRTSVDAAVAAVNAEFPDDDACVIATALYRRAEVVATVSNAQAAFDVVRIEVLGVYTLKGLERTIPTDFFTLTPRDQGTGTVGKRP